MKLLKIGGISGLLGLIAGLPVIVLAQPENPPPAPPLENSAPVNFSPGVRDILKMVDAKVDSSVINAYIKNSPTAYNPSATEIIALKQRGVSDDVVTTLLQRGAEVRTQLSRSAQSMAQPAPLTPPESMAPNYDAATAPYAYPAYSDYGYGYPYYGYGYSGYPYYSSLYWNTWYPWAWYSPFYHGYYGHHFYGHYPYYGSRGFSHFGGHSFAVGRGGSGFGNRSGAWSPVRGGFAGHNSGFVARGGFGARGSFGGGGVARGGFSGGHMGGGGGGGGGFHGGGHR